MPTFPELRALMAKYGMNYEKMGRVINTSYATFSKKLNCVTEFTFSDILAIRDFFVEKGEDTTADKIFFDYKFTKVNERGRETS